MDGPKAAPELVSQPPLERLLAIHDRLRRHQFPNCRQLAEELDVASKTIQRDLDYLRSRLGLPLAYDGARRGYYYAHPVDAFPTLEITEGELLTLLVAKRGLEAYRGTPFEASLHNAFARLRDALRQVVTFSFSDFESAWPFRSLGRGEEILPVFRELSRGVLEQREVVIAYQTLDGQAPLRRRIRPYHLACVDHRWYCISYCLLRNARRTFALARILEAQLTRDRFESPADFSPQAHLAQTFGLWRGQEGPLHEVVLHFDAWASARIKERVWHPSQRTEPADDGLRLLLLLENLTEIQPWILGWGHHVRVLSPASLRETIATQVRATARLYEDAPAALTAP